MADSLLIGNVIELMMGDTGPVYSALPNLQNTIFALNDQVDTYSLGAPQPTVDIIASLITDGERPQGRRASNRVLSVPVAILSDTRDNLTLARETLMRIVDQEEWTLRYTRNDSDTGPLVLDCWRAEPATIQYSQNEEAQFVCELTLNFEALPYGRSDIPNSINFLSPAAGTTAPPGPILMDSFNSLVAGQTSPWASTSTSIDGNTAIYCIPSDDLSIPSYTASFLTPVDLTSGGTGMNNIMHFWVGLASQRYYGNWANHKSEMAFAVYLTDTNGYTIGQSVHSRVSQSNNLASPKWVQIGVRMHTTDPNFLYNSVAKYNIQLANYPHNGISYVRWSTVFLDSFYAVSPSSSVANVTRGSIYQINGVEGSVHTAVSFTATQQPSTSPITTTFTGTTGNLFQAPSGVYNLTALTVGPGGPAAPSASTQNAGGGAELAQLSNIPVTPGTLYPVWAPAAGHTLGTANFAGTWTGCGSFSTTNTISATGFFTFTASVAAGNTVLIQVVCGSQPTSISAVDSGGNTYVNIGSEAALDGTFSCLLAAVNIQTALTTSSSFDVSFGSAVTGVVIQLDYAQGFLGYLPNWSAQGDSNFVFAEDTGRILTQNFVTPNADFSNQLYGWQVSGTNASAAVGTVGATNGIPNPNFATIVSTSSSQQPTLTNNTLSPVLPSTSYLPEAMLFMPTQTSMVVNMLVNWYDATQAFISTSTVSVTLTASTWQWSFSLSGGNTFVTSPSNAAYCSIGGQQNSSTANNPLSIACLGLSQHSNEAACYVALVGNGSGLNAARTPAGWTGISSAVSGAIAMDTFSFTMGKGASGLIFGASGFYSSAVNWGCVLVRLSNSAGYSYFRGDNNMAVLSHGGIAGTAAAAGGPGTGSYAPLRNDGGSGATGGTTGGGGGGSGGTGSSPTWVEETNGSVSYWASSAPPIQITGNFSPGENGYYSDATLSEFTVGGQVVTNANMTNNDMIAIAVVSQITGSSPGININDSQGNTYVYYDKAQIASNTWQVQLFTARASDQSSGVLNPLSPGDHIRVGAGTTRGNYAIQAWVIKQTRARYNAGGSQEIKADFTGTSHSDTFSSLTRSPNAHFALAIALDAQVSSFGGNTAQTAVYSPQYPTMLTSPAGGSYVTGGATTFPANSVLQAWWMEASSNGGGGSTSVSFTRPYSGELSYLGISTQCGDGTTWNNGSGAQYHGGTSKYYSKAGAHLKISWTGSQIQLMGKIGPDQGLALISIDKGSWQTIDNYAPNAAYQKVLFDTGKMGNVAHTLELVTTGTRDPSSTNSYIDIDGYQIFSNGTGISGSGQTGGVAVTGGGAGGAGGNAGANGANGGAPGGGGGGAGGTGHTPGLGGAGEVQLTYVSSLPAFKTLVLHRPFIDGSKTLMPYIACATQGVPTSDLVTGIYSNIPARFQGTYSFVIAANAFNSPSSSRTITVTVNEYENVVGGNLPSPTEISSVSRTITPSSDAPNNIVTIGELTLPGKDIPPDNNQALYYVSVNSTNGADLIQDVMMLDTMGQTVTINDAIGYPQFFIDEPTPDQDIGRVMGSQFDRPYAISVLDSSYPTGGPMTLEPGDNILFAYCYEGAPALAAIYFPRYYLDRTLS